MDYPVLGVDVEPVVTLGCLVEWTVRGLLCDRGDYTPIVATAV
jgi:hypothetical protein